MPRSAMSVILLLLIPAALPACADDALVLAEDACRAPFALLVPADLVRGGGRLGVVLHYEGEGSYLLLDLTAGSVSATLHRGGEVTRLGEARASLAPGGEVAVRRRSGGIAVSHGATTVLRVDADLPDGGRWGLLDAPADALEQIVFQPTDDIVFSDDFMRTPGEPDTWQALVGDWRVSQLQSARFSANAFTYVGAATGGSPALVANGHWFWEDHTVEAAVRASEGARGFGVGLALQDAGHCHLLRFVPEVRPAGMLQLVRVRGRAEEVLAEAPAVAHLEEWHRLSLSAVGGRLTGALDGIELVAAEDPTIAPGQALLWVDGAAPVAFDDVDVYSGPRRGPEPVVLSHAAQTADPGALAFVNDPYMQEWADERNQWAYGSDGIWHAGYFWGDVELAWELSERALRRPVELHLCVPAVETTLHPPRDFEPGYHLALSLGQDGSLALTLRRGGEVRAEADLPMPESPATVTLRRSGALVEALVTEQVVAGFTDDAPLPGGKVGLSAMSARSQSSRLRIVSRNLIDSTFRSAPTDWHIASGEWGVASRWACTPRWSWFQGRDEEIAAIWTRRSFEDDLVVEFFAGVAMDQPWAPFYQRPGNLCVTLCGSDATPGSGYSLVFAGWGNSAAGIFRRGELVARVPGFTQPDILDSLGGTTGREDAHKLHNEWWHVRAERIGSTVRLLVDDRLAASFDDPDPLPGGAVGIWTLDNSMTVARARIYHQQSNGHARVAAPTSSLQPRPVLSISTSQPHHVAETFDGGVGDWAPAAADSCALSLSPRGEHDDDPCLLVTNPSAGGSFALAAPDAGLDLATHPVLAFEYAIPEDVHVDVFALVAGRRYRLRLTGPEAAPPGMEDLGAISEVRTDGGWRRAAVDLLGLMRPFFAPDDAIVLDGLELAAHAVPEYMHAGIGGNPAGASWRLDSFFLGAPLAERVRLRAPDGARVTCAGRNVTPAGGRSRDRWLVKPIASGVLPIAVEHGRRLATDLVAFDRDAPTVEPLAPAPDAAWLGPAITVRIADVGPAGIAEDSLAIEVEEGRYCWPDPALRWRPGIGELSLDLRAAGIEPTAGDALGVRVGPIADRAGNRAAELRYSFTPDPTADTSPPDPPRLTGLGEPLLDCDFEADAGPLRPWGPDAAAELRRVRGAAAGNEHGGQWCLQARCTKLGGLFGVDLGCAPFEASRYPVLVFDYRAPEELRVDLLIEVGGSRYTVKFTDNDATWPVIGGADAIADDRWHTATVDLRAMLQRAVRGRTALPVTTLAFATSGWPGNRRDSLWWLDNVRLLPVADLAREGLAPELVSHDESSISDFAWTIDSSPATDPPVEPATGSLPEALVGHVGEPVWLHARAQDGAGNWSAPGHLPLRVVRSDDATPPVASAVHPADGAAACVRGVQVTLTDEGAGVSPADLLLTVNGERYTIADGSLNFDESSGALAWTAPQGVSLGGDGDRVACSLRAADLAGNQMPPLQWTWRLDYSSDAQLPPAPVADYRPARAADANDFEEHTGGWGNFVSCQVLRRTTGGAMAPGCLELRHLRDRGRNGFALIRDFGDDWRRFPVVRLRYRLESTRRARMELTGTTFDGSRDLWTDLGSLPVSGDGWNLARLDIAQAVARTNPSLDIHRIFLSVSLPSPDDAAIVDDYAMYSQAADSAAFAWAEPPDASGVSGYSWLLDSADDTVPPETITGSVREARFQNLAPGHYCFHVRACDGAGNWGPPAHVPVDLIAPE